MHIPPPLSKSLAVLAGAVALGGCGLRPWAGGVDATPATASTRSVGPVVELAGGRVPPALRHALSVENLQFHQTEQRRPELALDLVNLRRDRQLDLQVRAVFRREDGSVIDSSNWDWVTIQPDSRLPYRSLSFSRYAVSGEAEVRVPEAALADASAGGGEAAP